MNIEYRITTRGTCETLEALPKGAKVEAIDDREFIDFCESCGKPILAENAEKGIPADRYESDGEGVNLCGPCADDCMAEYENEQRQENYVTREMALDAGDPSLEGTRY